jgi:hypothetical protein
MFVRIPLLAKVAVGAGGAGLLALGALGVSTPVLAATTSGTQASLKHHDNRQDHRQIAAVVFGAEASVLGMKPEDLRTALKQGKKVSDLAGDKGMTKEQFGQAVATAARPDLDKLVDAKKITADQAQKVERRLAAGHVPFWNGLHRKKAA